MEINNDLGYSQKMKKVKQYLAEKEQTNKNWSEEIDEQLIILFDSNYELSDYVNKILKSKPDNVNRNYRQILKTVEEVDIKKIFNDLEKEDIDNNGVDYDKLIDGFSKFKKYLYSDIFYKRYRWWLNIGYVKYWWWCYE